MNPDTKPHEPEYPGDIVGTLTAEMVDKSDEWLSANAETLIATLSVSSRLDRCPFCADVVIVQDVDVPGVMLLWNTFPSIIRDLPVLAYHMCVPRVEGRRAKATPLELERARTNARLRVLDMIARGERDGIHGDGCGHFGEGGVLGGEGGGKS
jgi:hypothetical protein